MKREAEFDELRQALRELLHAERRLRAHEPGEGKLSWPQYRVVQALVDLGGSAPAGRLATAAEMTPASLTQAVGVLERLGLAQRVPSDEDRRRVDVVLTADGRARHADIRARVGPLWEEAFGDYDAAQIAAATDALQRLRRLLESFEKG